MGNLQSFVLQTIQFHMYIKGKFPFPTEVNNLVLSQSSLVSVFPGREAQLHGTITQVYKDMDTKPFFKENPPLPASKCKATLLDLFST